VVTKEFAEEFSVKWIDAFNSRDLDKIFDLYDDGFSMKSPYIQERMGITSGVLVGKEPVRPYWVKSLAIDPPIQFKLICAYVGVDSVIVHYENVGRKLVCETFTFNNEGKIISGCSQHGPAL
jgi:hypothetical protein